jgi:hypothetical protein
VAVPLSFGSQSSSFSIESSRTTGLDADTVSFFFLPPFWYALKKLFH